MEKVQLGGGIGSLDTFPSNFNGSGERLVKVITQGDQWYKEYLQYDSTQKRIRTLVKQGGFITTPGGVDRVFRVRIDLLVPYPNLEYIALADNCINLETDPPGNEAAGGIGNKGKSGFMIVFWDRLTTKLGGSITTWETTGYID